MVDQASASLFPLGADETPYLKLTSDFVSVDTFRGQEILTVDTEALRLLSETAFADINHLLRASAADLDWQRLLRRFGEHWPVLLSHLILFGYVYPAEARNVPPAVWRTLLDRAGTELGAPDDAEGICRGPFMSRAQYLIDLEAWGYRDPRLHANGGPMTRREVRDWTDAIDTIP